MGIRGLSHFMREKCEGGFENVKLSEIAKQYRVATGKPPVMLVDLPSSLPHLAKSDSNNKITFGEIKRMKDNLEIFINKCWDLGIKLKIYSEGIKPKTKYALWPKKFERLETEKLPEKLLDLFYYGILFNEAICFFQSSVKCEYARAIYEVDDEIIRYARQNGCFAILTFDSDFFMAEGVQYCLSAYHLNLRSMTTGNFNSRNLAKHFGFAPSKLQLFASLCNSGIEMFVSPRGEKFTNFKKIGELIKTGEEIQMNEEQKLLFSKTEEFYRGVQQEKVELSGDEIWDKILKMAEERHVTGVAERKILDILVNRVNFLAPKYKVDDPSPVSALLPLRKEIYGIIFKEYPGTVTVTEHSFVRHEGVATYDVTPISFPPRPHDGLRQMWSKDRSEEDRVKSLRVFCRTIHERLTPEILDDLALPEELLFPFLAAFYLKWFIRPCTETYEMDAILMLAVLVNGSSAKDLAEYSCLLTVESLPLADWFLTTVEHIQLLNSVCGDPFCRFKTSVGNYFDGKVFNFLYEKFKNSNYLERKTRKFDEGWIKLKYKLKRLAELVGLERRREGEREGRVREKGREREREKLKERERDKQERRIKNF